MMPGVDAKLIIGRAERVTFPVLGIFDVPAKVDTGADSSSIWVSSAREEADGLHCIFFGRRSRYYSGKEVVFPPSDYSLTVVANSFDAKEVRYKLKLRVTVKGRSIRATFTLSDRSPKTYPILLGRRMLKGKFLVDVSIGEPLISLERSKSRRLKQELLRRNQKGG